MGAQVSIKDGRVDEVVTVVEVFAGGVGRIHFAVSTKGAGFVDVGDLLGVSEIKVRFLVEDALEIFRTF